MDQLLFMFIYAKFLLDHFCAFVGRSVSSQITVHAFLVLSDLNYSHFKVNFAAKIKAILAGESKGLIAERRMLLSRAPEVEDSCRVSDRLQPLGAECFMMARKLSVL